MTEFNKHAHVIYADSAEKLAKAVILYPGGEGGGNPAKNCLFWVRPTEEFSDENKVMPEELADLAMKGLVWIEVEETLLLQVVGIGLPNNEIAYTSVFTAKFGNIDAREFTSATHWPGIDE